MDAITPANGPIGCIQTLETGEILTIAIDRPQKLNAFSPEMLGQLAAAFTTLEHGSYRCGVLVAEGPHFSAGLELDRCIPILQEGRPLFPAGHVDPCSLKAPLRTKPLVCAVKGICFTLGIELMLAADIVVAADDCRFAQLEVKRGLIASEGASMRMVERAGWGNAQRYLLTGDEFDAAEALRLGFVQEIVPAGRENARATELAARIAAAAPCAVRASLASSRRYLREGFIASAAALDSIQQKLCATDDFTEGIRSFVERRPGRFTGR